MLWIVALKVAAAVLVAEALTEIFVDSALFAPLRHKVGGSKEEGLDGKFGLKGIFVRCGYCISVWSGVPLAFAFEIPLPFEIKWLPWWAGTACMGIVVHRLSNLWHEAISRWFKRLPFSLFIWRRDTKE